MKYDCIKMGDIDLEVIVRIEDNVSIKKYTKLVESKE